MKKIISALFTLVSLSLCATVQPLSLKEITKPDMMLVKENRLYIIEKTTVFIYSLQENKLLHQFGQEGEGPKEFRTSPYGPPMSISVLDDKLALNSLNKISYFSKSGEFIDMRNSPINIIFYHSGKNFVGLGPSPDKDNHFRISTRLFNSELQPVKTLYHSEISIENRDGFNLPTSPVTHNLCYKNRIYVCSGIEDFVIDVLDSDGTLLYTIRKDMPKIPIDESYKKEVHHWFKAYSPFKATYNQFKGSIGFKQNYPAIRDMCLADDSIYIVTYRRQLELWECIRFDLKGKELAKTHIPLAPYVPFTYYPILFSVEKNVVYSLCEDPDSEAWQLISTQF